MQCSVTGTWMHDDKHGRHTRQRARFNKVNKACCNTDKGNRGSGMTRTRKQQRRGLDVWSVGFSHDWKCKKALKHSARLRKTTVVTNPGLHIFSLEEKRRAEIYLKGNKREAHFILVRIFQPQSIWPVTINNGGHGELWGAVCTLLTVRFCQHLPGNLFLHFKYQILPIVIFHIIHFDKNHSFIIGGRLCVIRLQVHHLKAVLWFLWMCKASFTGWSSDMSPIAQGYNFASGATHWC